MFIFAVKSQLQCLYIIFKCVLIQNLVFVTIFCLNFQNLILKLASNICAHLQKGTGYEKQLFWRKWGALLEYLEPKMILLSEVKFKVFEGMGYKLHQKYLTVIMWGNCLMENFKVICQNTLEWIEFSFWFINVCEPLLDFFSYCLVFPIIFKRHLRYRFFMCKVIFVIYFPQQKQWGCFFCLCWPLWW